VDDTTTIYEHFLLSSKNLLTRRELLCLTSAEGLRNQCCDRLWSSSPLCWEMRDHLPDSILFCHSRHCLHPLPLHAWFLFRVANFPSKRWRNLVFRKQVRCRFRPEHERELSRDRIAKARLDLMPTKSRDVCETVRNLHWKKQGLTTAIG